MPYEKKMESVKIHETDFGRTLTWMQWLMSCCFHRTFIVEFKIKPELLPGCKEALGAELFLVIATPPEGRCVHVSFHWWSVYLQQDNKRTPVISRENHNRDKALQVFLWSGYTLSAVYSHSSLSFSELPHSETAQLWLYHVLTASWVVHTVSSWNQIHFF